MRVYSIEEGRLIAACLDAGILALAERAREYHRQGDSDRLRRVSDDIAAMSKLRRKVEREVVR